MLESEHPRGNSAFFQLFCLRGNTKQAIKKLLDHDWYLNFILALFIFKQFFVTWVCIIFILYVSNRRYL